MIKTAVFLAFLGLSSISFGQIKKKLLGTYVGQIPAYELNTGVDIIQVNPSSITIDLQAKGLSISVGGQKKVGVYTVILETERYFVLEAMLENQAAPERLLLYKKGKRISREGLAPQPEVILLKGKR